MCNLICVICGWVDSVHESRVICVPGCGLKLAAQKYKAVKEE